MRRAQVLNGSGDQEQKQENKMKRAQVLQKGSGDQELTIDK